MLMYLVKPEGFHPQLVDLVYKLILFGLKTIDFNKISYFSLVFASQMLVLEYYSKLECLGPMLSFFLFQYVVFYLIHILKLDFDLLFVHSLSKSPGFIPQDKSSIFSCQTSFPQSINSNTKPIMSELASNSRNSKLPPAELLYILNPEVDLEKLLSEINMNLVELLNQITFCRIGLAKELIRLKVTDKLNNADQNTKILLKKKYEVIQEMKNRDLLNLLQALDENSKVTCRLQKYNNFDSLKGYLYGKIILHRI